MKFLMFSKIESIPEEVFFSTPLESANLKKGIFSELKNSESLV